MQYHLRVNGHLDASWRAWFAPLQLQHEPNGTTVLAGTLPDQAALYGVLLQINRLGLELLSLEHTPVTSEPQEHSHAENHRV